MASETHSDYTKSNFMTYLLSHFVPACELVFGVAFAGSIIAAAMCKSTKRAYDFPCAESKLQASACLDRASRGPDGSNPSAHTNLAESQSIARSCGNDLSGQDVASHSLSTHLPASNLKQHKPHSQAPGPSLGLGILLSLHLQARR